MGVPGRTLVSINSTKVRKAKLLANKKKNIYKKLSVFPNYFAQVFFPITEGKAAGFS